MSLPKNSKLPVNILVQIFGNMTNSYKALLFRSLIEQINIKANDNHKGDIVIDYHEICAGMLTQVVYPLKVFKLSFGKSDKVDNWLLEFESKMGININALKTEGAEISLTIMKSFQSGILQQLENTMLKFVLTRLIRPWFDLGKIKDYEVDKIVESKSQITSIKSLYRIHSEKRCIVVPVEWVEYICENFTILLGWWESNFLKYLEKK